MKAPRFKLRHVLITGKTESGKTTLAKLMAKGFKKRGVKVAVCDKSPDGWECDFFTKNPDAFLAWVKRNEKSALFVDEAGSAIGRHNAAFEWVATTGRHLGHVFYVMCHRGPQLDVTLRGQLTTAYVFTSRADDAEELAKEYGEPELKKCSKMPEGHFIMVSNFADTLKGVIDFTKGTVRFVPLKDSES